MPSMSCGDHQQAECGMFMKCWMDMGCAHLQVTVDHCARSVGDIQGVYDHHQRPLASYVPTPQLQAALAGLALTWGCSLSQYRGLFHCSQARIQ
jgi:hypothetical protein